MKSEKTSVNTEVFFSLDKFPSIIKCDIQHSEYVEEDENFDNDYVFAPYRRSTSHGILSDFAIRGR